MNGPEMLVPIALFAMIYGIVYIVVRKKERQIMIEKGADPSMFAKKSNGSSSLKYGLLLIGIAFGILIGNILEATTTLEEEVSYFSMIFIFGGISLLINYFLTKKEEKEKKDLMK